MRRLAQEAKERPRPDDLSARDPEFIEAVRPLLDFFYDYYFRCITEFEEDIADRPVLVVANHNGVYGMPDLFCHMVAFWRRYGTVRPTYGLTHDLAFRTPALGSWINRFGGIRASRENAARALRAGATLLVFPGGEVEACRPFRRRHRIDLAGRRGFLRLAIEHRVPIVPLVSIGGHHTLHILSDGRWIARALGLHRLFRAETFPIGLAFPWGPWFGLLPHVPPPIQIRTRVLRPIELDRDVDLDDAYAFISATMQRCLDELRRERWVR